MDKHGYRNVFTGTNAKQGFFFKIIIIKMKPRRVRDCKKNKKVRRNLSIKFSKTMQHNPVCIYEVSFQIKL